MEKLSPSLTLTPASVKVTVADSPITSDLVRFSQFKATVSGEVRCLSLCGDLELILRSQTDSSIVSKQTVSIIADPIFVHAQAHQVLHTN